MIFIFTNIKLFLNGTMMTLLISFFGVIFRCSRIGVRFDEAVKEYTIEELFGSIYRGYRGLDNGADIYNLQAARLQDGL